MTNKLDFYRLPTHFIKIPLVVLRSNSDLLKFTLDLFTFSQIFHRFYQIPLRLSWFPLRFGHITIPELGLLLDLTEAVEVVVDPGAGAVVEHAVVAQVGHRGQGGGRRRGVLVGLEGRENGWVGEKINQVLCL